MNVFLLHKTQDIDLHKEFLWNEKELTQDLELDWIFKTMASEDEFLYEAARSTLFNGLKNNLETIKYRQDILKDCIEHDALILSIYDLTIQAIESRRNSWYNIFTKHPTSILSSSIGIMQIYLGILKELSKMSLEFAALFKSEGFIRFFRMTKAELTNSYFEEIENHLHILKNKEGILISYELGNANVGIHSSIHQPLDKKKNWLQRIFNKKSPYYTFFVHPRDESGSRALSAINDDAINKVANILAQSNDHIAHFLNVLRSELAFYLGCLNLRRRLLTINACVCFPKTEIDKTLYSFKNLYDPCLALKLKQRIISNDLHARAKGLVIITGANKGGKSTFLRSIGISQLMMQSGMFVTAQEFSGNVCSMLITHFKREEDKSMRSGKFDEELSRMNQITDHIIPGSLLLFNESFAATNEREGSAIARQIVNALLKKKMRVFFVTHLSEFVQRYYSDRKEDVVFLRAQRNADKSRTYKLTETEPLESSFALDIFNNIFGN